jgi:glucose-6-phosphate 1-dehydrogenase
MSHSLVIFGASGDLTSRKLIPALYSLHVKGRLPKDTRVIGVARTKYTNEAWRQELAASTQKFAEKEFNAAAWQTFAANVFYQLGDIDQPQDFAGLAKLLGQLEGGSGATRLYYLATAPSLYATAIANLGAANIDSVLKLPG